MENQKDTSWEVNVSCLKDGRRLLKDMLCENVDATGLEKSAAVAMIRLFECVQFKMEVNPTDMDYLNLENQNAQYQLIKSRE